MPGKEAQHAVRLTKCRCMATRPRTDLGPTQYNTYLGRIIIPAQVVNNDTGPPLGGGTTGKQSGSGGRNEEGDEGEGQLDDQNRKARPRDWAVLARLVPSQFCFFCAGSRDPWDPVGRHQCPAAPPQRSITTLLGDTSAVSGSGQLIHTDTLQIWTSETAAPNLV